MSILFSNLVKGLEAGGNLFAHLLLHLGKGAGSRGQPFCPSSTATWLKGWEPGATYLPILYSNLVKGLEAGGNLFVHPLLQLGKGAGSRGQPICPSSTPTWLKGWEPGATYLSILFFNLERGWKPGKPILSILHHLLAIFSVL